MKNFNISSYFIIGIICYLICPNKVTAQRDIVISPVQQYTVAGGASYNSRVSNIDDTHFIVVWKESSVSTSDMYGRIGEVDTSSNTISYGSQFLLVSDACRYPAVLAMNSTQAVIFYETDLTFDVGSSQIVNFDLATNNITSVGSTTNFTPGDIRTSSSGGIIAEKINSTQFIVTYLDSESSNQGVAKIGTISGANVSFSPQYVFDATNVSYQSITLITPDTVMVTWEDDGTSFDPGKARIGSISGTAITWAPNSYTFHSSSTTSATRYTAVSSLSGDKFAIAWSDDAASDFGRTLVGSRNGTVLSFGSIHTFDNTQDCRDITISQTENDEYIIAYNGGSGDSSRVIVANYNGSTIDFGSHHTFLHGEGDESQIKMLNQDVGIVVYIDESNTDDYGEAIIVKMTPSPISLSASITAQTNVSCSSGSDGSLTATALGGTANYDYQWSNGATTINTASLTNTISNLSAGTYTVTVTDNDGNTATTSATITQPSALVSSASVTNALDCNGGFNGQITGSATGGTTPYTYAWNTGETNALETNLGANTYSVTITDQNGCTDSASVTLTQPVALVASAAANSTLDCNGDTDGQITGSATGGTTPFTYSWNTGGTAALETNLGAGTYSVTITDQNGCTDSASTILTQPSALVSSATVTSPLDCNGDFDGQITGSATGGTTPFTYSWNTGETAALETNLGAGTYSITITDQNGCTDSASTILTQPSALVSSAAVTSPLDCNGNFNGQITGSATGGTTPFTYSWNTGETNALETGLGANTYSVTITDQNGCSDSTSVTLTEPTTLVPIAVVDSNVSINAGTDGGATISVSGGIPPYSYNWSNSATTASITGVVAGTYSITITDANGCTDSTSTTITEPPLIADINTFPYFEGFENGPNGWSVEGSRTSWELALPNNTIINSAGHGDSSWVTNASGNYYGNENGAVVSPSFDFTANTIAQPYVGIKIWWQTEFNWDGMVLQQSTNNGASWTNVGDLGDSVNWYTDNTIKGLPGGQEIGWSGRNSTNNGSNGWVIAGHKLDTAQLNNQSFVKFRMAFGSDAVVPDEGVAFDNFTIGEPITSLFLGNDTTVISDSITLNPMVSEYGVFAWSTGESTPTITLHNNTNLIKIDTIGLTYTGMFGEVFSDSIIITHIPFNTTAQLDSNASCNGFSNGGATAITIGGTTPYTYLWSNGSTNTSITGIIAGIYTVTVTDGSSITSTSSVTITEPAVLIAASVVDSNISCNGFSDGGATASASGGTGAYTYAWSASTSSATIATTASITGVMAGTYSVTVTDANGCTAFSSSTVTQPTMITASIGVDSNVSCNGFADGGVTVSVSGGTGTYTYGWGTGASTASLTNLTAGSYSVAITDANGCSGFTLGTVTEPTVLTLNVIVDSNISCNGFADGRATASASGGTMPYTYAWSNAATTASITGVVAGTYSVTVTDANGCTSTSSATITQPAALIATSVVDSNISCNGFSNGVASASAAGGTMPYTYAWSNSATTASITGVVAGTYSVTISDNNGCTSTSSNTITQPAALIAASVVDSNTTCNGFSDGGATASASGGTGAYTYAWSASTSSATIATTASITGVMAGTYSVTVTDANGCTAFSSSTVTQPTMITASIGVDSNVSCNGFADGGVTVSVSGGTGTYTYGWGTGASTASLTNLTAGSYSVAITDANGCSGFALGTVTEPTVLTLNVIVDSNISCNGFADGGATASASGGTMPYTYAWSNAATTASITGAVAGTYSVTVTDANGCTSTSSATITQPAALIATSVVDSNISCNGFSDGGASASAVGGTMPYTYAWSNAATTASITGVVAGTYTVTVSDANGCTSTSSATVTEPATLVATVAVDSNESCLNTNDGGLTTSTTGGTASFTYLWSNGATSTSITGLTAGSYTVTITDANGCTDASSATITHGLATSASITVTQCDSYTSPSGNYSWNVSGTYFDTIQNSVGCDSNLTINLTILNSTTLTRNITACDSYLSINGMFIYTQSGTYTETILNSAGCDSVVTTNLTIVHSTDSTLMVTTCDEYTSPSGNSTWNTSGTYSDVIANNAGCDSNLTIVLSIINSSSFNQTVTICKGETFAIGASSYTIAGTYMDTLVNAVGCDSIVTTDLIVDQVDVNLSQSGFTLTADNANGTYQWIYCDSNNLPIPGATNQSYTALVSGNYAVVITENNCSDTSACTLVDGVGIIDITKDIAVKVFPNPAGADLSSVTIEVENLTDYQIVIRDIAGKVVFNKEHLNLKSNTIDISRFAAGSFFIEVKTDNNSSFSKLIVL